VNDIVADAAVAAADWALTDEQPSEPVQLSFAAVAVDAAVVVVEEPATIDCAFEEYWLHYSKALQIVSVAFDRDF